MKHSAAFSAAVLLSAGVLNGFAATTAIVSPGTLKFSWQMGSTLPSTQTISVSSSTVGAAFIASTPVSAPWLSVAPEQGLLPATPMLVSYDAPLRPQYWQLHAKNGAGIYFIAYYSPKAKLSELAGWFTKAYEEKFKESPTYGALNGFGDVMIIAQAVEQAKSTDPKAVIAALETGSFKSWSATDVTFPKAKGVYFHNWSPPILIMQYTAAGQDWKEATVVSEYVGKAP